MGLILKYKYSVIKNTKGVSYDYGVVSARNTREATVKARKEIQSKFDEVNRRISDIGRLRLDVELEDIKVEIF